MLKYHVMIGGGLGPNVWDTEVEVEAENIQQAIDKVLAITERDVDGEEIKSFELDDIFAIEQKA